MNLLSKFEEYMYFDIYIVAIFKAWQVIITGKCLTILIQWMDVNISLSSNYTEGNFSMYLKHFTLILGKIILDKKNLKFFPSITNHKVQVTMKQASKHIPWIKTAPMKLFTGAEWSHNMSCVQCTWLCSQYQFKNQPKDVV